MKVVIVAKTRMRGGACIGAISFEGQSLRLVAPDQETAAHFNLDYEIGEVWEIEGGPPAALKPPHVENIVVLARRRLRSVSLTRVVGFIEKTMPPAVGGPEALFEGCLRAAPGGALRVAEPSGVPGQSTTFWRPDRDLVRDEDAKRIRYRYPTEDGGRTLTFVGFQEPLEVIPAGSLLRVSLAHWWRPDASPDVELRCYGQLSGWYESDVRTRAILGSRRASYPASEPGNHGAELTHSEAQVAAARVLLKSVFGYDEFLPLQDQIVGNVLARRDTLAIMPTGGGKSLCYQLPALLLDGLTVVVSPLIALMQDQVDALLALGVSAAYLNSTVEYSRYVDITHAVRGGKIRLLYLAPETLLRPETLVMLDRSDVSCITIDEAHCISSWGHDFRPEYRQLLPVRKRYPDAVCLAFTATATKRVQEDIKSVLGFGESNTFVASFDRPNLFLQVETRSDRLAQVVAFLEAHREQAGIIYCQKRKDADLLASQLSQLGWSALPYHAGMDDASRRDNQRRFSRDETQIIVATIAFGMGINKSNVRFILHTALPENLENYYQQIGRAGRDGLPADCLLLWGMADLRLIRRFMAESPPEEQPGKEARLQAMLRYVQAEGCRRVPLMGYFGETHRGTCAGCDNCAPTRNPRLSEAARPAAVDRSEGKGAPASEATVDERALFEVLRKLRLKLARDAGIPPFVIFSDRTLQEMARKRPVTPAQMRSVSGVGDTKLARYGDAFIEAVRAFSQQAGPSQLDPLPAAEQLARSQRQTEIGMFFNAGVSVEDLGRLYGVKSSTVLSHLAEYHAAGNAVANPERLLTYVEAGDAEQGDAFAVFGELGTAALRPVYDALGGKVSFDDLRLLRIYFLSQNALGA